jgi:hypothetical protein
MTGKRRHRSSRAFRPWGTLNASSNVQQVFLSALAKRISHAAHGGAVILSTGVQNVGEVKQVMTANRSLPEKRARAAGLLLKGLHFVYFVKPYCFATRRI